MSTDISLKKNENFYEKNISLKKYINESIHTTVEMFSVNFMLFK